eukprot:RCo012908
MSGYPTAPLAQKALRVSVTNSARQSTAVTKANQAESCALCAQHGVIPKAERIPADCINQKMEFLLSKVREVATLESFRGIVFLQTKRGCHRMAKTLEECIGKASMPELQRVHPKIFVGHSNSAGEAKDKIVPGMSGARQQIILQDFREGRCNLLLATNVAEEGLDVPACNLVIRYDTSFSITSLIQSRGRARQRGAQFIVMAKPKELSKVDALLRTEASMKAVVRGLAVGRQVVSEKELLEWYHLAPAQLLEQYFFDFHRDHPEPRPRPHYLQCQTPHRISDELYMVSAVEVPIRGPSGELESFCATGMGPTPGAADQAAAVRACSFLAQLGVLGALRP